MRSHMWGKDGVWARRIRVRYCVRGREVGLHIKIEVCVCGSCVKGGYSGVTGGAEFSPDGFHREIFCWPTGKIQSKRKGKWRRKEGNLWIVKRKAGNKKNGRRRSMKMTLSKYISRREKNLENRLCPSEKYFSYATGWLYVGVWIWRWCFVLFCFCFFLWVAVIEGLQVEEF